MKELLSGPLIFGLNLRYVNTATFSIWFFSGVTMFGLFSVCLPIVLVRQKNKTLREEVEDGMFIFKLAVMSFDNLMTNRVIERHVRLKNILYIVQGLDEPQYRKLQRRYSGWFSTTFIGPFFPLISQIFYFINLSLQSLWHLFSLFAAFLSPFSSKPLDLCTLW